jgi:hypothetical protein
MKKLLFLTVVILTAATNFALGENKPWSKEPKYFRGVPFGASEAEALNKIPSMGNCRNNETLGRMCLDSGFKIGDVPFVKNTFVFYDDKLVSVNVNFKSKDYDFIKDVFIEKYGEPIEIEREKVKTEAGIEYENEILTWRGDIIEIHVEKYSRNINNGIAIYSNINWLERLDKINKRKEERGH